MKTAIRTALPSTVFLLILGCAREGLAHLCDGASPAAHGHG